MPRNKDETLSIRTTGEIKALLREAAGRERRSVASMVEVLVLDYAKSNCLSAAAKTAQKKLDVAQRHKGRKAQ